MQRKRKKSSLPSPPWTPFRVEIDKVGGHMSVLVSGTRAIVEFSHTRAVLKTVEYRVEISGKELCVGVYEGGSVEVIGGVESVGFFAEN